MCSGPSAVVFVFFVVGDLGIGESIGEIVLESCMKFTELVYEELHLLDGQDFRSAVEDAVKISPVFNIKI